jgi:outer membrane protein assembly factor BamB
MTPPSQPDTHAAPPENPDQAALQSLPATAAKPRLWFAVLVIAMYWALTLGSAAFEMHYFFRWISSMAAGLLANVTIAVWWLRNKSISRRDRLSGFIATAVGGIIAILVCDKSYNWLTLGLYSLPVVLTAGTLWLLLANRFSILPSRVGLALVVLATWGYFTLIRMDGVSGELKSAVHWRWIPSAEELFLAERQEKGGTGPDARSKRSTALQLLAIQPGDWPDFRGPHRDGVVHGTSIRTDWKTSPPKPVWKQRVGPGWSSMIVIGDRLFTQEQRGESEAIVCLDAATGSEIWAHQDKTRFWEAVAGAGPRATPTFADGRIYSQGATGILNCLDAATGELHWSRNTAAESGAKLPTWGFSSSPLVVDGIAIAFAGGPEGKGLLAYHIETGEPAWCAATGLGSYSSPQLASLDGNSQVLFLSDGGLIAVAPESGTVLWQSGGDAPGAPVSLQPLPLDESHILIQSAADFGMALIDVTRQGKTWETRKQWGTNNLKPSFNDFVVVERRAFGFDGPTFACFDLETQKRRWKQGRYGYGQVILLAEQRLLLVLTETGDVVLLSANPDRLDELGRFHAIDGKTWNHPALARGRLYVRNAEEMACFELAEVAVGQEVGDAGDGYPLLKSD